jgi:hypothetical protein
MPSQISNLFGCLLSSVPWKCDTNCGQIFLKHLWFDGCWNLILRIRKKFDHLYYLLHQLSGPLLDVYNNACRLLFNVLAEAVMCKVWMWVTSRASSYNRFQCGFEYFFLSTGCRSVSRDLETQIAIVTKNPQLRQSLLEERERLYASSTPFNSETLSKPDRKHTPLWVHVIMRLFRGLF